MSGLYPTEVHTFDLVLTVEIWDLVIDHDRLQ